MLNHRDKAEPYEGQDIMVLLDQVMNNKDIVADELTKGRIRSIYVKTKYGSDSLRSIADYYDIPIAVVKDIESGKIFRSITSDLR